MNIHTHHDRLGQKARSFLQRDLEMLIDGRWVPSQSGKVFDTYDPGTGRVIARVAEGDAADVDLAVKAARRAFENGPWNRMTPSERGRVIWKLADLLEQNADEFAELEVLNNGWLGHKDFGRDTLYLDPGKLSLLYCARACRGRRANHPMECAAGDVGLESGSGSGGRLHDRT